MLTEYLRRVALPAAAGRWDNRGEHHEKQNESVRPIFLLAHNERQSGA